MRSGDPAVETAFGELFLETDNSREALKSFQIVIKAAADWPRHMSASAKTIAGENPPMAAAAAEEALKIDPDLADAHLVLAGLDLDNTRYDAARERIERVLKTNPSHLDARALWARSPTSATTRRRSTPRRRACWPSTRTSARSIASPAIWPRALSLRRGRRVDAPRDRAVSVEHRRASGSGTALDADRRRRGASRPRPHLQGLPHDVVTFNLLGLLDKLEKFDVVRDGDLVLKFDPNETTVLREYAVPLAHEALEETVGHLPVHAEGADPHRDFPDPR